MVGKINYIINEIYSFYSFLNIFILSNSFLYRSLIMVSTLEEN